MNQENIARLKKYVFFICVFVSSLLLSHIIYLYLYHDAKATPIEGGSVSEGIIGKMSHLNPLIYSNDYNKNIIDLLYRSLLKYDYNENKIVWDLANCDIKNISYVECYLKDNIKWSNGKPITANDVVATYNIIKNGNLNPVLNSLLEKTTIEEKSGNIIFRNKVKDVNFINVLLQPIVSKETLDNIGNKELSWEFNSRNGIYSGPYKVENVSYDDTLGIERLSLTKNEVYSDAPVLIQRYIFKFFKDTTHFLKHKDIVNIFYDQDKILWESIPRLSTYNFYLNKYVSFFINEEKVKDLALREFILSKIKNEDIIKLLPWSHIPVNNAYLLDENIPDTSKKNNNIESIMKNLGYVKIDALKEKFVKELETLTSKSGSVTKENTTLQYVQSPFSKKYNFLWEDNILISWKTNGKKVDEIYINNYKLASYKAWDEEFFYRLKLEFKNMVVWENKYVIEFKTGNKREKVEEFFLTFSSDEEKLKTLEKRFFEGDKEQTQQRIKEINEEITKIDALDKKYYYNKNYEKFELNLSYLDTKQDFLQTSTIIKNILSTYGISVNLTGISANDLNTQMTQNKEAYDMILVGIDLGYFNFNIFPYFHSSQASGGYNFSNTKSLNLDIALEELKSNILSPERTKELEVKVLTLLGERHNMKTLYTKKQTYLVDQNIKDFSLNTNINSLLAINQSLKNAYISSEKSIDFSNKNLWNFIHFLKMTFKKHE